MIKNLPTYIPITFILITITTFLLFYLAVKESTFETTRKKANAILFGLICWLVIQMILTHKNVYNSNLTSTPPKILIFGVLPINLIILLLFVTRKGRQFIDGLPLINITYLNIIRISVELVLWWLFLYKAVPQLMTFEGRNFDILAGITAPFIAYFGLTKGKLSSRIILVWNFICLALLLNIVMNATLSAPLPLQKFAFDQPNIAILYFPFSW